MCEQLLCVIQCVAVCSPVPCVSKLQFMLQCVVLQCVAVCCNVLQCNAVYLLNIRVRSNQSPIPPTNCNPLQTTAHFATHCNTLQHTATHCNYLMIGTHASFRSSNPHIMNVLLIRLIRIRHLFVAVYCSVLQCVAVCCSVLQCVAVCCRVLQYAAVCCRVLQCTFDQISIHQAPVCCREVTCCRVVIYQPDQIEIETLCSTLHYTSSHCNTLHHTETPVLQCVAVWCNVLHRVAS